MLVLDGVEIRFVSTHTYNCVGHDKIKSFYSSCRESKMSLIEDMAENIEVQMSRNHCHSSSPVLNNSLTAMRDSVNKVNSEMVLIRGNLKV